MSALAIVLAVFLQPAATQSAYGTARPVECGLADGFKADGTPEPHDERSSVSAAGSMDTDIADQARLWAAIVRGEGLSPATRQAIDHLVPAILDVIT